jgi:hypothetical protein
VLIHTASRHLVGLGVRAPKIELQSDKESSEIEGFLFFKTLKAIRESLSMHTQALTPKIAANITYGAMIVLS